MSIIKIIIVIFDVKKIAKTELKIVKISNIINIIKIFLEDFIKKIIIIINIIIAKTITNLLNIYLI